MEIAGMFKADKRIYDEKTLLVREWNDAEQYEPASSPYDLTANHCLQRMLFWTGVMGNTPSI